MFYGSVKWVVDYGIPHRDFTGVKALGVDEIHVGKKDKFGTLVYQIDENCKRLLWVGRDRTEKTCELFFEVLKWVNKILLETAEKLEKGVEKNQLEEARWKAKVNTLIGNAKQFFANAQEAEVMAEEEQNIRFLSTEAEKNLQMRCVKMMDQ